MTETTALAVIWGLMWVLVVPHFLVIRGICRLLRSRYPQTWDDLGAPSLLLSNTLRSNVLSFKFIWSGSYRKLDDRQLSALVAKKKVLDIAVLVLLLVFGFILVF